MKTNTLNLTWFIKNITSIRFRHRYRAMQLLLLCFGIYGLSQAAAAVSPFHIGEQVRTIRQSAIYLAPPFAGQFLKTEPAWVQGTITEGPVRSADVWWWKVQFDQGVVGWVAERQIHNLNGQAAGPRINSTVQVIQSPNTANNSGEFGNLNPPNGGTVTSQRIVLRGTVTDDVYAPWLISFSINGSTVPLDLAGNFNVQVNLRQGTNNFQLRASEPNPRQQINEITAYLDGSVVYGSDATRTAALRTFQGGALKTSTGNLPPLNVDGLPNANDAHRVPDNELFLCGDVRSNENIELTAIQTLFVREHNQIAAAIAAANHSLNDERIFQMTRRIVAGELQVITYHEFVPALLGSNALRPYAGYTDDVNSGIATEFSTGAYRIGHTLVNDDVEFLDNDGNPIREALDLADAFFNPVPLEESGADPILKYLATDNAQAVDTKIVGDLRNFLFGPPGAGGFDLASLNIQRGRDHGLADYNSTRVAYGLPRVTDFSQITSDPDLQAKLFQLYGNVDSIDLWIGGLAEDHVSGASVGPTFRKIIANQFERVRDGDRFWYQRVFNGAQLQALQQTRLSDIIRRNTVITKIQDNVFFFDDTTLAGLQPHPGYLPPALIGAHVPQFNPAPIDGVGNNNTHRFWGAVGSDLMRFVSAAYGDSLSSPAGSTRPGARFISNTVVDQGDQSLPDSRNLSDWAYGWGQFIDHDLDLTTSGDEEFDIPVPPGDPFFDPDNTGNQVIFFSRSIYDAATGTPVPHVQQQNWSITYRPRR
ncbi:MAG TPA: peroxidase family protein [Candidatus Udaeobacter sp.]